MVMKIMVLVRAGAGDPQGCICCRDQELPKSELEPGLYESQGSVITALEDVSSVSTRAGLSGVVLWQPQDAQLPQ